METEAYSLQSPEQIAKDYGGNKQKIAEAMQTGIIDPTAGMLAAMFIDRMRNAAQAEQVPQQTVAQQVFAPPAPMGAPPMGAPAGLGATPEAAAMPAPAATPMGEPPMPGMAEGGMVPPYMAGGGLSDLPLPDDMFDENRNGGFNDGYAPGGLVAFAKGDEVVDEAEYIYSDAPGVVDETGAIVTTAPQKAPKPRMKYLPTTPDFTVPANLYGYSADVFKNLDAWKDLYRPETKQAERVTTEYERALSPEEQKKRRQEDMWMALGQIGAKMATTPGSLLQAASAGIGQALPGVAAAAKERKAEQKAALKGLQEQEGLSNKEALAAASMAMDMQGKYATIAEAMKDRAFKDKWGGESNDTQLAAQRIAASAGIAQAGISASATRDVGAMGLNREIVQQQGLITKGILDSLAPGGANFLPYMQAVQAGNGEAFRDNLLRQFGVSPIGGSAKPPPPPPGFKPD